VPRFETFQEWNDDASQCAPTPADDSPVIAGQSGVRRRATPEEVMAIIAEHRAAQEVERDKRAAAQRTAR